MDSITQAALGAAVGGAILGPQLGRKALLGGALLGTLPDLDIVLDYGDAVANFTEHRGFSHSLLVLVPFSLVLAAVLQRWQPRVSWRCWWAYTGAILVTHPLLDAFTTYGTQLFWPLGEPVAISSIFIIDPLYTLPLVVTLLLQWPRPHRRYWLAAGLMVSSVYLGWSLTAQQLIERRVQPALAQRGLEQAPRLAQPMPFSLLLWRVTVMAPERRLEIVTGFLDGDAPLHIEDFPRRDDLQREAATLDHGARLHWFTDGFVDYRQRGRHLIATDIRLGVPGAHPFAFIIAERHDGRWEEVSSQRLPEQPIRHDAWEMLWARTTGRKPVLCLADLSATTRPEHCATGY